MEINLTKEHVSETNRIEALKNLDAKIEFYREVLHDMRTLEDAPKVSDILPKSLRGFNSWEILNRFVSNAAETLRKDVPRTRIVQLLIKEYRDKKAGFRRNKPRSELLEMKSSFDLARAQLLAVERGFAGSRVELSSLRYKCETFIAQKKNLEREFFEMKKFYSARVLELEAENKELREKLSKVFPLKRAK